MRPYGLTPVDSSPGPDVDDVETFARRRRRAQTSCGQHSNRGRYRHSPWPISAGKHADHAVGLQAPTGTSCPSTIAGRQCRRAPPPQVASPLTHMPADHEVPRLRSAFPIKALER